MGTVLDLEEYRRNNQQNLPEKKIIPFPPGCVEPLSPERYRALALQYISNASALLSMLGEDERRVSWLLNDCLDLLDADTECAGKADEN